MGIVPEGSLVVKRTFLEFEMSPCAKSGRARCFSDSGLLQSASLAVGSVCTPPPKLAVAMASPSRAPAFPVTPMLDAMRQPDLGCVNLEATAEVKAVLGLGPCVEPSVQSSIAGQQWLLPSAAWPHDPAEQHAMSQQLYVFVPLAHSMEDCSAQVACWADSSMWQPQPTPSTSSTDALSDAESGSEATAAQVCETRTTVMLRGLPSLLTRNTLLQALNKMGFTGLFDMVYVPINFGTGEALGYAFINLVSPAVVPALWRAFDGFSAWDVESDSACTVCWSEPNQGLSAHIERYRNSPVMHPAVPDDWRPAVFVNGIRTEFPPPTQKIKAPKVRGSKAEKA
eukprot:CAMPEP_0115228930 /NCGR_PEP_ID=MMETSP0270-20121206/31928_1 /TAXON_ID=71861 /ORGANISM="Scrippsiella trochoidea, Strain CCMP3099" /LENGTH=339 /DNA_ID=CAMNT_0002643455 /DNA_START=62 /DNA_END=1081 /DNA_ORIENTATION=-